MKNIHAYFSLLTIALVLPGMALGAGTCDQLCSATKDSVKALVADPTCKSNASCLDCVATNVLGSQQGAQCDGYKSTKKGATNQVISASLYTATGVVCGISCAITKTVYGSALQQPLSRACGGLGLATAATDIAFALTSTDIVGGLMGAVGGIGRVTKSLQMVKKVTGDITNATMEKAAKKARNAVCINAAIYLGTGVIKSMSVAKMKKAEKKSCGVVESLATVANGPVQACLASAGAVNVNSTLTAGLFSVTASTFTSVTSDDVNRQEAVAGKAGDFMKEMKADLDAATAAGKLDIGNIAKRIENGESVSAIVADAGLPPAITDPLKEFEAKVKAGEHSPLLASLSGGGYSGGAGTFAAEGGNDGTGDLVFGGNAGASPGEGSASLEIERKPAHSNVQLENDGDVFHESFGGSIFDIVTYRLKEQKENYAELAPEGRMNRLFNGYSDPTGKSGRKPASVKPKSAK